MKTETKSTIVVEITKEKNKFVARDKNGKEFTSEIKYPRRKQSYEGGTKYLKRKFYSNGNVMWRTSNKKEFDELSKVIDTVDVNSFYKDSGENISKFLETCYELKPNDFHTDEMTWKYLIRSVLRGKNIMMTGYSGCGKTMGVYAVAKALNKKINKDFFVFNFGSMQEARTALIGSPQFNKDTGTYFNRSEFIKAITTPNAIVLLDELTRAHPDAENILMSVLDPEQRFIRLDEDVNVPGDMIKVAGGVSFIATANVGLEFRTSRLLDRATNDRFVEIDVEPLNKENEFKLLKQIYPRIKDKVLNIIADTAAFTREEIKKDVKSCLDTIISTRMSIDTAGLCNDGIPLQNAFEVAVYPKFIEEGNSDRGRSYLKIKIQAGLDTMDVDNTKTTNKTSNKKEDDSAIDGIFTAADIKSVQVQVQQKNT